MKQSLILFILILVQLQAMAQPTPFMKSSVSKPKAGQKLNLSFHVSEGKQNLTDFETVHEKKCHLMLVSADYQDYQHIHPKLDKAGNFDMPNVSFKRPGLYYVFFDVTPEGSKQIIKRFDFQVEGQGSPLVMKEDMAPKKVAGIDVKLATQPAQLVAGDSTLVFRISQNGKPVTDLKPLMGALGHVLALGPAGKPFLHIHPLDAHTGGAHQDMKGMEGMDHSKSSPAVAGEVSFHASFPKAGLYKVWGQFLRNNQEFIVPFTVRVGPAPASNQAVKPVSSYTCPMHAEVHSSKPGACPKCGMNLVPSK